MSFTNTFLITFTCIAFLISCDRPASADSENGDSPTIHEQPNRQLYFEGEKEYHIKQAGENLSLNIKHNVSFETIFSEPWIKKTSTGILSKSSLIIEIEANNSNTERSGEVIIKCEEANLADTLKIIQERNDEDLYQDGQYTLLQKASTGDGVNLVIMGDGFTRKDLQKNGRYESTMQQAYDYFFSIDPYKSYKSYFNVYMLIAESKEEGINGDDNRFKAINNKFGSTYGDETEINCNTDLCFEYIQKISTIGKNTPTCAIIVLNSTKYAGTTYLYSNGSSLALCPMSSEEPPNDFEGIIHHEVGGHGFGFLCDEYIYYNTKIPKSPKNQIKEWQMSGYQMNVDFTDDTATVLWNKFISIDKYKHSGAYEGGSMYQYGIWRSEANSCMNNNIPYYNVQSRWVIVNRIMELNHIEYSLDDFIKADNVSQPIKTRTIDNKLPPLGSPQLIRTKR